MNIPNKFEFYNSKGDSCTAVKQDPDCYKVHNTAASATTLVTQSIVKRCVKDGVWKIKHYNGVDSEGKPLNFTVEDLKPFMRVTVRNGTEYIVVPCKKYGVHGVREGDLHNNLYFDPVELWHSAEYTVDAVYEAPNEAFYMLNPQVKGALIWKRQEHHPSEQLLINENIQKRLDFFSTHIEAVKENLESLQREYDELRYAVTR
jgi:hypothetical protein